MSTVGEPGVIVTFFGLFKIVSASFTISGGIVAEKKRVWRLRGSAARTFLTS